MPVPSLSGSGVVWGIASDGASPPPILCTDPVLAPWLPGSLPTVQYERMHAALKRVSDDPNGRTLLRAYATWAQAQGRTPDIVWREGGGHAGMPGIPMGAAGGMGWLVDLDYLASAALPDALKTLAGLYKDATRLSSGEPYHASLALDHPLRAIDPQLEQAWRHWLASAPPGDRREARERAIVQMRGSLVEMRCYGGLDLGLFRDLLTTLDKARPEALPIRMSLDLSYLGLDSIPPIPPGIRCLNLSGNALGDWRNMPRSLRTLELRNPRGMRFEAAMLPADLAELDLSYCDLGRAPAVFLDTLCALDRLVTLSLRETNLDTLPRLGGGVRSLDISGNRFRGIPANLPAGLVFLYAAGNPLESLPASMDELPAGLRGLFLRSAATTHLEVPEALRRNRYLAIDLGAVPTPASTRTEILLRDLLRSLLLSSSPNAPRYREAAERWDAICRELFAAPGTGAWNDSPGDDNPGLAGDAIPAREATAFHSFLQRLTQVPAYRKHGHFRNGIRDWLVDLAFRPALRETTLGACREANETCSDRVVLAYNRLAIHRLNSDIDEGLLDGNIPRVLDIARQVYTLGVLSDVAAQLVHEIRRHSVEAVVRQAGQAGQAGQGGRSRASSRVGDDAIDGFDYLPDGELLSVDLMAAPDALDQLDELEHRIDIRTDRDFVLDELEIHLAVLCLVCGPDALDLWALAPERMTLDSSQVDGPRVRSMAMAEVQRRGEQEFPAFLVLDYPPWTGLLKRQAAEAYARADARRYEALETAYEAELDAAMRSLALDGGDGAVRDDARKDAGPAVARRMQLALLLPVTMDLLESASANGAPVELPFDAGTRNGASPLAPTLASASATGWRRV